MLHQRMIRTVQRVPRSLRRRAVQRSCGKTWFIDRIAADLALARICSHGVARAKDPLRSYHCPRCHGWHLTSAPARRDHDAAPKITRRH
ncbi:hypothetical protein DDE74_31415 [Streptomyces lydicus]|uniref:Uncharacterized protein n=2 Tax=Streptomyces lydicus TaxID=47763 RepID=A0A3Q9KE74_9ACTN|nr:hypothetical protein DDE74_31415 [Streptomyces lydicus]